MKIQSHDINNVRILITVCGTISWCTLHSGLAVKFYQLLISADDRTPQASAPHGTTLPRPGLPLADMWVTVADTCICLMFAEVYHYVFMNKVR